MPVLGIQHSRKIHDGDNPQQNSEQHMSVTCGGKNWWQLEVPELLAFIGVNLLMDIRRRPNHRLYWKKSDPAVYCAFISSIMSRQRYEDITRCIHIPVDKVKEQRRQSGGHAADKVGKVRWLMNQVHRQFIGR